MPPKKPTTPAEPTQVVVPCPCGKPQPLKNCCLAYIQGRSQPPTAELLMRSRYTAHSLLAIDYLWNTWSSEQRKHSTKTAIYEWAASCEWLGLDILTTHRGGVKDTEGVVEFVAHYRRADQLCQHREVSLFKKRLGKWLYVDHGV